MAHVADEIIKLINRTKNVPILVEDDDVTYASDHQIQLDTEGTAAEREGDVLIFEYRRDHSGGFTDVTISVNGHTAQRVRVLGPTGARVYWQVNDITRYAIYIIKRVDNEWHLIGGTVRQSYPPFNLFGDVPNVLTSFEDDDFFLVGDASANVPRRGLFSRLKELFRPSAGKDGTIVIQDPSAYNFRGDGVESVQAVAGQAWINIPASIREVSSQPTAADLIDNEVVIQRTSDNFAEKAYIKSNRKNPFFQVTPADLGDGHIGYATGGLTGLSGGYAVNSGGSTTYNDIAAISEQYRSFASSTFERVGAYTIGSMQGLGAYGGNLYELQDLGSNTRIVGRNPATAATVHTSTNASPTESTPQGLTVLNGIAYFYGNQRNRFYSYDIDNTTWTQLSTNVVLFRVAGMANANGNIYVMYRNSAAQWFIAQLDTSDGSLGTSHRLTGYDEDDHENTSEGLTSVDDVLYLTTIDTTNGDPFLYEVNPSNGNLTVVDEISPSNADLAHLTQLGNYIYAWNDQNNGIYRAEAAMGNRWVAIFTNASQEIDDTDQKLRLYKQSGADEIELIRDDSITDAVVFASSYDDETANTIAVGTNENPALYKADGTQLFEGSNEAILAEMPIGMPKVKTRGQLIATTDELPTAADSNYITEIEWTIDSNAPDGFEVDADGSRDHRLYVPHLPPENVNGLEIVVEVDGVEVNMAFMSWGPGNLQSDGTGTTDDFSIGSLVAGVESNRNAQRFDVLYYQEDIYAVGEPQKAYIVLHGDQNTLPSGTVVKVYLSGVFMEFETDLQIGV